MVQIYTNLPKPNSEEAHFSVYPSKIVHFMLIFQDGMSRKYHYRRKFLFQ